MINTPQTYRTMHVQVVDRIGLEIVSGETPVGGTLDPEAVLAERLGVSRGAIREAAKALAAKGMVELRPRTGTRVLDRSNWNLLDRRVLWWLQQTDPDALTVHLAEVRRLIEPGAAALAAERVAEVGSDDLMRALAAMEVAHEQGDPAGFTNADVAFHHELLRLTRNPLLTSLNSCLEVALGATFAFSAQAPGALDATIPLHRHVAEAVAAGKPAQARAAMERLLATSASDIAKVRGIDAQGDPESQLKQVRT